MFFNHFPEVRLVNMKALLEDFRIVASVVSMSAKLVITTKHRLSMNLSFHILEMSELTDVVLVSLLLTLNRFRTLLPCFHYAHVSLSENISCERNE